MSLCNGKLTKPTTSDGVAMDARERRDSEESSAPTDGPAGSVRRVCFADDATDASFASGVNDACELRNESGGSEPPVVGGLYERVLEGLRETCMSMRSCEQV